MIVLNRRKLGMKYDIVIKNANIITVSNKADDIPKGFIAIKSDRIAYIGSEPPAGKFENVIDARGNIVMPGLINAHTHAAMSIYRGYADDIALFDWLKHHIWPAEEKFVTEENIGPASELSIAEMIRSGTTTFSDMYFYSNITQAVAERKGIRAILGEAVIDTPFPAYKISENYWKEKAESHKSGDLVNYALVPHSPYSCSKLLLQKVKSVSKKTGMLIHTHISETQSEVDQIRKKYGLTPVEYLDSLNFLDSNVAAVHCAVLSDNDINILSKRDVKIVHCIQSNLKLASGIARITDLKKAGVTIALGTDGQASNNTLDMFSEMKTCALVHKAVNVDTTVLNAKEVVEMATINGAKVLGMDKITGSIEEGKKADLIIIDISSPHLTPMYDPYSHVVYSARGSDVETVIINGKIVMQNRKLITIDEKTLIKKINKLSAEIRKFKMMNGVRK